MTAASREYDVAVVGGGLLGSAIAWGLARRKCSVAVLDEGDRATRASRGNFALVWVQSKGLGMPEYAGWTVRGSNAYAAFADELRRETGIDVHFERPGGFHLALSETELEARALTLKRLHNQPHIVQYETSILSASEVRRMLPDVGPEAGAPLSQRQPVQVRQRQLRPSCRRRALEGAGTASPWRGASRRHRRPPRWR